MGLSETDLSGFSTELREIYPKDTGKMTSTVHTNTENDGKCNNVDKKTSKPYLVAQKASNFKGIWVDFRNLTWDCLKLWYDVNGNAGTRLACVISGFFMLVKSHPQIWLDGWRWGLQICKVPSGCNALAKWRSIWCIGWYDFYSEMCILNGYHVMYPMNYFEARVIRGSRARVY